MLIIGLIVIVVVVGYIVSSVVFRAKSYSNIIDVNTGTFSQEVTDSSDDSFSTVPRITVTTEAAMLMKQHSENITQDSSRKPFRKVMPRA